MSYMVFAGACGWAALVERSGEVMGTMIKAETKLPDNLLYSQSDTALECFTPWVTQNQLGTINGRAIGLA